MDRPMPETMDTRATIPAGFCGRRLLLIVALVLVVVTLLPRPASADTVDCSTPPTSSGVGYNGGDNCTTQRVVLADENTTAWALGVFALTCGLVAAAHMFKMGGER